MADTRRKGERYRKSKDPQEENPWSQRNVVARKSRRAKEEAEKKARKRWMDSDHEWEGVFGSIEEDIYYYRPSYW